MSWIELLYWTLLTPTVFICILYLGFSVIDNESIILPMMGFYLTVSLVFGVLPLWQEEEIKTSSTYPKVVYEEIIKDKLVIITYNGDKLVYEKYSDIQAWQRGDKLKLNTFFTKNNFGIDTSRTEYVFEGESNSLQENKFKKIE